MRGELEGVWPGWPRANTSVSGRGCRENASVSYAREVTAISAELIQRFAKVSRMNGT